MTGINRNVTGTDSTTEQVYKVWDIITTCIRHRSSTTCIRHRSSYDIFFFTYMFGIYRTWMDYVWYISGIYMSYFIYLRVTRITKVARCHRCTKWPCLLRSHCCSTEQYELSVSSNENTLVLNTKFRHMYHLLGPDPNRRGTDREYRPEADVSLAFIGLVPCLNTNGTFKHQRHCNTNSTFRFFKFRF